jgi:arsenate reductase
MAYAFACRETKSRGLDEEIALVTGGTRPAEEIHPEVVEAMSEIGIDISGRPPREVTVDGLKQSDLVITMGCSADDVCPAGWGGETRDWGLDDPDGRPAEEVREIRDEIERRVTTLFDELSRGD